jgi:hypothetical protein
MDGINSTISHIMSYKIKYTTTLEYAKIFLMDYWNNFTRDLVAADKINRRAVKYNKKYIATSPSTTTAIFDYTFIANIESSDDKSTNIEYLYTWSGNTIVACYIP